MTITTNTATNNQEYEIAEDNTGLDEIQKAIDEIEKLKNDELESEETEEVEAPKESSDGENSDEENYDNKEDLLWKVKKDKYRALAAKDALMQENSQLKQMLNESLNSGTYHYGKSAYADLEKAKESKKKAIEEGNIDALIESDIALTKALNTVSDLEKWAYNESQNKTKAEQYQEEQPANNFTSVEHEIATDWLDNHSYLQPTAPDYNPKLATQVAGFINHLDANLAKNGQMDAYFSEPYFKTIESYITEIKNEPQNTAKKIESVAHIGSVRNSYNNSGASKASAPTQMILTADERRMCANAGISEKEWLKYKLEDLKRGK
jgi:hypothetical protein